jgi:tetratricopeptide (TPR) repeat protein
METPINQSSETDSIHWLDIAEIVAVISSIGGSITCILLQKFVYASVPLSASVALNLFNRQRIMKTITEQNQSIVAAQLEQSNSNNLDSELEAIEAKIQAESEQNQARCAELAQEIETIKNSEPSFDLGELNKQFQLGEYKLVHLTKEIKEIRNSLSQLNILNRDLDSSFSELNKQQEEIDRLVKEMRVLGKNEQNLVFEENTAKSYYERAVVYQNNGYHDKAQENYQKALQLEPNFAEAYHHRGVLNLEIGQKKQAVEDLRKASQLYFEKRDLDNYHLTRDLSQKVHQPEANDSQTLDEPASDNKVVVNDLFSE